MKIRTTKQANIQLVALFGVHWLVLITPEKKR